MVEGWRQKSRVARERDFTLANFVGNFEGMVDQLRDSAVQLQQKLHSSNSELSMSALGQKRTSAHVSVMSGLPPKADMVQHGCDVR